MHGQDPARVQRQIEKIVQETHRPFQTSARGVKGPAPFLLRSAPLMDTDRADL